MWFAFGFLVSFLVLLLLLGGVEGEACAVGVDVERDGAALNQGVVPRLVVAGGKVVADGDVVALKVLVEQLRHVLVAVGGLLLVGEASHHDALDAGDNALEFEQIQHAHNAWHALAHILKEEYHGLAHPSVGHQEVVFAAREQ